MSDTGATADPTVTVDGVTVTKSYESDEFPVPAVAFRFRSDRTDEAVIRLVDAIPEGIPSGDLGFHPDYGSDHWSIEDGNAVFERRLDPDEEYETVYGIRATDHDPDHFMDDPDLEVNGLGGDTANDSETSESKSIERDTTQAARDVITGESAVSGLDDEGGSVEDIDLTGTTTTRTPETPTTETNADGPSNEPGRTRETEGATMPSGSVGAALAAEFRDGSLSETDREVLTNALKTRDAGNEVRLTHLQSRISDLEAYTDALEAFIDEHGPARQLIEDLTEQLETIEADLDDVTDRTTTTESEIDALEDRTEANERHIDAIDKGVADVQAELIETRESIEELHEEIEAINDWRSRIAGVFGGPRDEEPESDES